MAKSYRVCEAFAGAEFSFAPKQTVTTEELLAAITDADLARYIDAGVLVETDVRAKRAATVAGKDVETASAAVAVETR